LILLVTAGNRKATYSQRKAGSKEAVRKTTQQSTRLLISEIIAIGLISGSGREKLLMTLT
jgi:hypothetical protein